MSGILGVFGKDDFTSREIESALKEMKDRGPDSEGYVDLISETCYSGEDTPEKPIGPEQSIPESNIAEDIKSEKWLGHRRLKLKNSKVHQPLNYKNLWMVFDGDILNLQELVDELEQRNHDFTCEGEAEVFLHAFEEWGKDAVKKVRGYYAACIFNSETEEISCINDPLGGRTLYYMASADRFLVSSTIKPLLSLKNDIQPNPTKVIDYLKYDVVDNDRQTFFKDIYRLTPGHILKYDKGELEIDENRNFKEVYPENKSFKDVVKDVINLRETEEKTAVTVSGGLDSSVVATEVDEASYYFVSFPNLEFDETEHVLELEKEKGFDVNKIELEGHDLFNEISEHMHKQEEPTTTPVAQVHSILCKKLEEDGVKVMLSGHGADGISCGFGSYAEQLVADLIKQGKPVSAFRKFKSFNHMFNSYSYVNIVSLLLPTGIRGALRKNIEFNNNWVEDSAHRGIPNVIEKDDSLVDRIRRMVTKDKVPNAMRFITKESIPRGILFRPGFLDDRYISKVLEDGPEKNLVNGQTKYRIKENFGDQVPESILERNLGLGFIPYYQNIYDDNVEQKFREIISTEKFSARPYIKPDQVRDNFNAGRLPPDEIYRIWNYEMWMREFFDQD